MPARQLRLFPAARPLEDRLGLDFFRGVPVGPGVYTMRAADGRILYIGQSATLRSRLSYYRGLRPESAPRKLIRLVNQVDVVEWTCCATAAEAVALEKVMIRNFRPKFNVAFTSPPTSFYLGVAWKGNLLEYRLAGEKAVLRDGQDIWGPFPGRRWGRTIVRSLARSSWICLQRPSHCWSMPHSSYWGKSGCRMLVPSAVCEAVRNWFWPWLEEFLHGRSLRWLERLEEELTPLAKSCGVMQHWVGQDLEGLRDFFERALQEKSARNDLAGQAVLWPARQFPDPSTSSLL